jgi:hypothetical protein
MKESNNEKLKKEWRETNKIEICGKKVTLKDHILKYIK